MMDNSALIGAIAAALVLVGKEAFSWYLALRQERRHAATDQDKLDHDQEMAKDKQELETAIPVNEQAVRTYKDIVDGLRGDLRKLSEDMKLQDKAYIEVRIENIMLKTTIESQRKEIESLNRRVTELEHARLSS